MVFFDIGDLFLYNTNHIGGPYSGDINQPAQFNGSGSNDLDGSIVSYEWDFGDGTNATGVSPTHIYTAAGTYTVTLTVVDDDGNYAQFTTTAVITQNDNQSSNLNRYIDIAAGYYRSLALKEDGSIVCWGSNHGLAVKSDGTIVAWGYNGDGQINVPE